MSRPSFAKKAVEKKVATPIATASGPYLSQTKLREMVKEELNQMRALRVPAMTDDTHRAGITRLYVDTDVESFEFTNGSQIVRDPKSGKSIAQPTIRIHRPDAPPHLIETLMHQSDGVEEMIRLLSTNH